PIHPRSDLRRAELVALVVILGYGIVVRAIYLDRPFHRDAEGVACFYGQLARNYIRRPFSETKAVPVQSLALDTPPTFYSHHPPLIPLEIAAVYWTIGFRASSTWLPPDWPVRLPTALFTLACIVTIWRLLRNRGAPRAGMLAAALF